MLDLKAICEKKQQGLCSVTDPDIIKSLANYENTVNEGYQGRLLFELIQNARDAAYKAGINSRIIICLQGDTVYVGNTGMPFDEAGITAMTRLGVSDKADNKTIGHKGIGFKAIQEYSSTPEIITRFGTIFFNKSKFHQILSDKFPGEFTNTISVPLFYYPHYKEATIKNNCMNRLHKCETVIAFQLNKDKTPEDFVEKFQKISNEELILLQNIESISLYSDILEKTTTFSYNGNEIIINDTETFEIIRFPQPVLIPDELYTKLSEKEQQLFAKDREIDIKIVFRLEDEKPVPEAGSHLYLFYPLEMKSGFPYKIHSYFSCNPQRTSITQSHLNDFIFEQIIELQVKHVLPYLKAKGIQKHLLRFVSFKEEDEKLTRLYRRYTEKLKTEKFIWVKQINDFLSPEEIMLCDEHAYNFLNHHKIEGKTLFLTGEDTAEWLTENFDVSELDETIFCTHIEAIVEAEKDNPNFFEKLYQYINQEEFTINNKKILLGEDGQLYSGINKVFMRGEKVDIKIPGSIQNKIILLHPGINMERISPDGLKRLGIIQFSRDEIAEKALDLFEDEEVNNSDIIIFLLHFQTNSSITRNNIRKKVKVPVGKHNVQWVSPLYTPVYIENEDLRALYPNGYFINYDVIEYPHREALNTLFLQLNVWDIPAVYYIPSNNINSYGSPEQTKLLGESSRFTSSHYTVYNDRVLDLPQQPNAFFYNSIKDKWSVYVQVIENRTLMPFSVKSSSASYARDVDPKVKLTTFCHQLRKFSWIKLNNRFYKPSEAVGINRATHLNENHINKGTFNWLVLDYEPHKIFFNDLQINHINSNNQEQLIGILTSVYKTFGGMEGKPANHNFKRFYHTILKYVYTTYDLNKYGFTNKIKGIHFLSIYHKDEMEYFSWQLPEDILHIDDTKLYHSLSSREKQLLGYFFTKSDKNEIGKVFNQIAPKLSSRIEEKVEYPDKCLTEKLLYTEIKNLIYIILLVEDKIEDNLKEEMLQKLLQVKIRLVSSITRQMFITYTENKTKKLPEIKLSYHFDASENKLYISSQHTDLSKEKKLFAEMVNHVFTVIVQKDFDLKLYIRDLMMNNQSESFIDARKDIQIDPDRFETLKEVLDENHLNEEQIFWDAVLKCKCPGNSESPFTGFGQTDRKMLAVLLEINPDALNQWHGSFDYTQYNSAQNLSLVREMVNMLNLDFAYLNELLSGRLNFEAIYKELYGQYKNKYTDTVKYNVYETLEKIKDSTIQSSFQEFVKAVDNIQPEPSTQPVLFFNAESDILNKINTVIQEFGYTSLTGLEENRNNKWRVLKENVSLQYRYFTKRIGKTKVNAEYASDFIMEESHYSLLYFGKTKELVNKYIQQYPAVEEEDTEDIQASPIIRPGRPTVQEDDKDIVLVGMKNIQPENPYEDLNKQIVSKSTSSGGGYRNPAMVDNDEAAHTGKSGEWLMFTKLSKRYQGRVTWVSDYGKEWGHTPDKNAVGYDMRYIDEDNNTHYVEVKTSKYDNPEFHITINEIKTAMSYGNRYHVMWITNVFDIDKRRYADLGNIFIDFSEEENFFYNSRFKPALTAFRIAFNPEIKETVHQLITKEEYETA